MVLIEAMKEQKLLLRKIDDLRKKITSNSALMDYENPPYSVEGQGKQIKEWQQSCHDCISRVEKLRIAVQRTNLQTEVTIKLGSNTITKSIAAWIHRRRDLANLEESCWNILTDKGLKDGFIASGGSDDKTPCKIVRFYDLKERDNKVSLFSEEPILIDTKLEIVNATTDLVEEVN